MSYPWCTIACRLLVRARWAGFSPSRLSAKTVCISTCGLLRTPATCPSCSGSTEVVSCVVWFAYLLTQQTGAFVYGGSAAITYNGAANAARGVVIVSINYRLGTLGYLALPELSNEPGNGAWLFLDQQMALQFVRDNIARFGGNPNDVTLWGESAGCASVTLHMTEPTSWPYFHKAICESSPAYQQTMSVQRKERLGSQLASRLCPSGSDSVECMRNLPATTGAFTDAAWLPAVACAGAADRPAPASQTGGH